MSGIGFNLRSLAGAVRALFAEGPRSVAEAVSWAVRQRLRPAPPVQSAVPAAAKPWAMLCWQLESPDVTRHPADPAVFEVRGWIGSVDPIASVRFADAEIDRLLPISLHERPDISAYYGGLRSIGFTASCAYDAVRDRDVLELDIGDAKIIVPAYRRPLDIAALRRAKLERLEQVIQCPNCDSTAFNNKEGAIQCRRCRSVFPRSAERYDFLTSELRERFRIEATENVSANVYDGEAYNLIHRHQDGLVLDCGSGLRDRYFGNVVNYEIVPYATTDVLGVGEKLPFRDGAFDAVFSFAVLEHVKDPFACSRELLRVLRPGGTLYCQVPFLQPVHGYPSHYMNATRAGMENLFGDAVRIEKSGPFLFGQPVFALSWILNRYAEGLPPEVRERFKSMRVEELLRPGNEYLGNAVVTELSLAAREVVTCCNAMIATKLH